MIQVVDVGIKTVDSIQAANVLLPLAMLRNIV